MQDDNHLFDTSNYPASHFLFSNVNKKVPGKMKDETESVPISRFVGLKSKMYALEVGGRVKKTGKGIKKSVLQREITFDNYMRCLNECCRYSFAMTSIRSYDHLLYSIEQKKVCLSSYDDKRHILPCGIRSVPYGHFITRATM
jgi:hypothetical protein